MGQRVLRSGFIFGVLVKVLIVSWWSLFIGQNYPEVLVLEYGADHPGDIKRLVVKYKPHISVVTTIGMPVHIEYFSARRIASAEKMELMLWLTKRPI